MHKDIELRHLPAGISFALGQILDGKGWKEVMAIAPCDPNDLTSKPKYTVEQIRLVEEHSKKNGKSFIEIFLDEWGTSGKSRPTLETLLKVLVKAQMFRAADYIAVDLLKESPPNRPNSGPAAPVNVNLSEILLAQESTNVNLNLQNDINIAALPYHILCAITNQFDETSLNKTVSFDGGSIISGHKLGAGGFGDVFYGRLPDGREVAVKRLKTDAINLFQQFQSEISSLSLYKHPNLLSLIAFSADTSNYCLVYEYMHNGSLQDCLADPNHYQLSYQKRLEIAMGVCRGIHYLHTARSAPLIHCDVKSANILLDRGLSPRLGDFGLVRAPNGSSTILTSTAFGTSAYMAPEAFRGDLSVKTDVFSVGVVFLELLTALQPYDPSRDGADLVTFVENNAEDTIEPLLDLTANWDCETADKLFDLSKICLDYSKKNRPLIADVLNNIGELFENISNA